MPGSLNFGLDGSFATFLGWLVEWRAPLTLLAETPEDISQAQRALVRIGIDRPAAATAGDPHDWIAGTGQELGSFPTAAFAELAQVQHHRPVIVLDVRREDEYAAGHIDLAVNIPIHEVPERLGDVPDGGLGGGGSILAVPVLVYALGRPQHRHRRARWSSSA